MATIVSSFVTTAGSSDGRKYYQDTEISPATTASGVLQRRFDTLRYPGNGVKKIFEPNFTSVTPNLTSTGQTITEGGSGLTSFTLTYAGQPTTSLAAAATAATIQAALESLSTIGTGNVTVTGSPSGPYTVTFTGALAGTSTALLVATPTGGTGTVTIARVAGAAGAYEVQIVGAYVDPGVTVSVSGSGVTVSNIRRGQNGDSILATFTVAGGAAQTARDITVTNIDTGAVTATGVFTVS